MLIDTHCHIPMLMDENSEKIFNNADLAKAKQIIEEAAQVNVKEFVSIGSTSYADSLNCDYLAQKFSSIFAAVGILSSRLYINMDE
jgi:Tat protein secretion system quality control protein TatD with DNase activity